MALPSDPSELLAARIGPAGHAKANIIPPSGPTITGRPGKAEKLPELPGECRVGELLGGE